MSRQREQWVLEFRVGPGEHDGKRGVRLHRQSVDPSVCAWFKGLVTDPAFPIDARLGSFHIYVNDDLASSIVAKDLPPPVPTGPSDVARADQLRGEVARLEARVTTLTGQAGADEARLRSTQAELAACEAKITAERERVAMIVKTCDEEIAAARAAAREEKEQIRKDTASYREAMLQARKDTEEMFEHLRTIEIEESKHIARRRNRAQEQLSEMVEACADLEDKALGNALTGNARPTVSDQAAKMGISVNSVVAGAVQIIDRIQRGAAQEAGE